MKKMNSIGLLVGLAMSGAAIAADGDSKWGGEAELGLVSTTGNTETQTISAKAKIENDRADWHHALSAETLRTENASTTTAERYLLTGKTDYKISELSYAFGRLSYEDDRFSGYEYQATAAVGMGYRVINQENLTLNVEGGPGVRDLKLDNASSSEDETTLYLSGQLGWKISETSDFTEELTSEIGENITITKSVTGLKSQIAGNLAMKITYTVKNTSEVPVGVEKTDTETAITLVYGF